MKTLRVISLALSAFLALASAWYVNAWDYETAYSRGLFDGARVGFHKGIEIGIEKYQEQEAVEPALDASADPAGTA